MPIKTGMVGTAPVRFAVDSGGQVYGVNGVDQPFVWDGVAGSTRNWGIAAPPAPAAGAIAGVGNTGTYYYQITWYNANTGEYGAPLALDLGPFVLANQGYTVNRPSTAGIDSQITHWRLWRTTAGQSTTFYKVADTVIATGNYNDILADSVIAAGAAMSIVLDSGVHNPPDQSKPFIRFYKGRFILYGSRIEKVGTATMTNAANTVAGAGTNFRASHVGQWLYIDGETVKYEIATVTNATTATIVGTYAGGTGSKTFRLVPKRPSDVAWSQADSESFARASSTGVFPADGDLPTGLEIIGTSLVLFKRSHAYMFDYGSDPNPLTGSGNLSQILMSRGLVRQECCVPVGQNAFCLDSQGIYQFDGTSQGVDVDQGIRRLFQPDDEIPAAYRINRQYSDQWHGTYDQRTNSVLFFVTTGSETTPQTALRFSLERQQWTMDQFNQGIGASCQGRDSYGEYRAWVGDLNKWVWALSGTRQCEGNSTGTLSGTATAGAAGTLTDAAAAFVTTGNALKGVYVTIASGTGAGQSRLITSNTATVLTISPNWTITPDTTSKYIVGAVESIWKSVWHFIEPTQALQCKGVTLLFEPTTSVRYLKLRLYKDFETAPVKSWRPLIVKDGVSIPSTVSADGWIFSDTTFLKGRVRVEFPINFMTCFAVEMSMLDANKPTLYRGYDLAAVSVPEEFD